MNWLRALLILAAGLFSTGVNAQNTNFGDFSATASSNTDIDGVNIGEGWAASVMNNAIRAHMALTAEFVDDLKGYTSTGTGAAYVVATTGAHFTNLADIHALTVDFHTANTSTTPTIAVDGLAATTLVDKDGGALIVGAVDGRLLITYNGTNFQIIGALGDSDSSPDDLITTRGDIIVGNSSAAAARLAVGASGTVVASDGTDTSFRNLGAIINGLTAVDLASSDHLIITDASDSSNAKKVDLSARYFLGSRQIFTASGTWTKPAGVRAVFVQLLGPGGGGGGATGAASQTSVSGGGGAGEYAEEFITSGLGATETITIGTGGAGGAVASTPVSGDAGSGASSFGAHLSAGAGAGGVVLTTGTSAIVQEGGVGGSGGTGGNFHSTGMPGGKAWRLSGTSGVGGDGGSGPWGGAGQAGATNTTSNGDAADANTGAGGGGAVSQNTGQRAGGDGAAGICIVWEYY